ARIANSERTSSAVIAKSLLIAHRLVADPNEAPAADLEDELVDEGDREDDAAEGHRELRKPERRGVVAGRDVVKGVRLPGELAAVDGEERGKQRRGGERPDLEGAARAAVQRGEQQRDADVLAALERVREGEEAGAGHHVAGVRVDAGNVEAD